jgi:hypothetical protein
MTPTCSTPIGNQNKISLIMAYLANGSLSFNTNEAAITHESIQYLIL